MKNNYSLSNFLTSSYIIYNSSRPQIICTIMVRIYPTRMSIGPYSYLFRYTCEISTYLFAHNVMYYVSYIMLIALRLPLTGGLGPPIGSC